MTIQASRTNEFTVDQLCTLSLEMAGLTASGQTPQPKELGQARKFLDMALKEIQTHGVFARSVSFVEITMIVGTYKYDLPASTIELVGDAMYINANTVDLSQAPGETIVQEQSRDNWQRNSAKDAMGQPTLYFLNRAEVPQEVWLWPVPDEAGTIRFQQHRMTADTSDGSATIDLLQYWMKHVMYNVAEMLADAAGFSDGKISRLHKRAKEYLNMARSTANQGTPIQMSVGHGSGGSAGRRRR